VTALGKGLHDLASPASAYRNLLLELEAGRPAAMVTFLRSLAGSTACTARLPHKVPVRGDGVAINGFPGLDDALKPEVCDAFALGAPRYISRSPHGPTLIEPCFPAPTMIVLGGGHVAAPVVEMASKVGFLVTVIDDRPVLLSPARFPSAHRILCDNFEGCLDRLAPDPSAYVVIVTRGHRYDIPCLRQALGRELAYVGMLASRTRVAAVRDRLLSEGITARHLERLHAPIGLEIGALTPEEIAVSIVAEAIRFRRRESTAKETRQAEFDRAVIERLAGCYAPETPGQPGGPEAANSPEAPGAIVTIIATEGSTPRRAGAKMLVLPDGRILGSIGGGYTEAQIISHTLDSRLPFEVCRFGLDSQDDMLCGGYMEVLIERLGASSR
jgi:xanthine dehydrogenase accessory factor